MSDLRRQELHCHACNRYVQFEIDLELDGNHVLECPNCGHEHCRVVKYGEITDIRWNQRNQTYYITGPIASSSVSTYTTYDSVTTSGNNVFLYDAWMNVTGTT